MTKIGILTCANSTQGLGCSSYFCLQDVRTNGGTFAPYAENGGTELIGIISCSGCPTSLVPEKILSRVRSLAELGVEAIHMSSCMMALCPYKNKYKSLIQERFPEVNVVVGTHGSADNEQEIVMFREGVKQLLTQPRQTMVDLIKLAQQMHAQST